MKIFCRRAIVLFLLLSLIPFSVFATPAPTDRNSITYFEDGSYLVVELITIDTRSDSTKTSTKNYTYYGSDNTVQWRGALSATFTYNGTSAACTVSVCTVSITNGSWYTISKSSSKSGNTAYGYLTMGRKYAGVTVEEKSVTMKLSCSPTGVIS